MSWIKPPENLTRGERRYLKDIETLFNVKNAKNEWIPYKLEPHQMLWHLDDVALKGENAKHKLVIKSRNTSFTTSSIISVLMAVPFYPSQVIPIVRLNMTRAKDLINDFKEIIKHMNVIEEEDGRLFPFNPKDVYMDNVESITFPNGVEIRAFPATNASAETIRGLRIAGCGGIIDESNFMKDYKNIYIALRDASSGVVDGKKEYQILIGTTRKGRGTPFNVWFEDIEKLNLSTIKIYKWAVFNPNHIDLTKPLTEQNLVPIAKWHSIEDLEEKRKENINTFKEEYMAELVDGEDVFYEFYVISRSLEVGEEYQCIQSNPVKGAVYYMGIDPSSGVQRDYFSISIFEKVGDYKLQRYLYYTREKELPEMERECIRIINEWSPKKVRIDSTGLGTQLSQKLVSLFGGMIEPTKGNMRIKGLKRNIPLALNEYMHTTQKHLMSNKVIGLIDDELQIRHYSAWNNDYKADSGVVGHGDIVVSNGLALLPDDWKYGKIPGVLAVAREKDNINEMDNINLVAQEAIEW